MTQPPVPPAGPHGDDARRVATALGIPEADVLDLAASLNPVAPDVRLIVAGCLDSLRSYPDSAVATAVLAEAIGVDVGQILLTNGGAEAIALVAGEMGGGWVEDPEFSLYRRHLSAVVRDAPKWRSNPHNPTGRLASPDEGAAVWDEAFYPLATGCWTRGDMRAGSVVLGSLTKLFACPGLRLGYVLSEDDGFIARLTDRQPRWAVGSLALSALPILLRSVDLPAWAKHVGVLREQLCDVLAAAGLRADPSDANFVLVQRAAGVREGLARHGIVVRDCASFGMPEAVRIAVPSAAGLERLAAALAHPHHGRTTVSTKSTPPTAGITGALMVCGTASDVGKSQIVTGLCRLLARRGVRVAPFKAQNMSLNSFATPSGHEIGRAQGIQAMAARTTPEVAMNPILLKPTGERRSQVVVMGRPTAELDAVTYQALKREVLLPVVLEAFADLRSRFDVVICEGAGSPAEINLLDGDIANLSLAAAAGMPAILVGDIERGGVFAALYGTVTLLPEVLRERVQGFVINKFRGDETLLRSGVQELESRTGVRSFGVLPYLPGLSLDAEDSLGLAGAIRGSQSAGERPLLDVVVIALPHLANFTDLDALAIEPTVGLRLVATPSELGEPDVILLPGSKATVADLEWLRETGLAAALSTLANQPDGPTILGVCAGYQMLGAEIVDEVESGRGRVEGLGLLAGVTTEFESDKLSRPRRGRALGEEVTGYEIRQGRPVVADGAEPFATLDDEFGSGNEGASANDGRLAGTNLHGLFESDAFRTVFLAAAAQRRGKQWVPSGSRFGDAREAQIDRLADLLEGHLDVEAILALIATASEPSAIAGDSSIARDGSIERDSAIAGDRA